MNTKIIIISTISAVVALACSKSISEEPVGGTEIKFIPTLSETRSNRLTAGNMIGKDIHVDGYLAGTENKHLDGNVFFDNQDEDRTDTWLFFTERIKGVHYYWPQKSNLDVLAYCPANLENTYMTISSSKTVTCTNLPMADSLQKGTLLNEFVCGYRAGCKESDGAISMVLKRPFAILRFVLDDAVRCNVNYIKVQGLYNCGTYCADSLSWKNRSNSTDLMITVNKKYPDPLNHESPLCDSLLVIPQSMRVRDGETNPVKLIFSYTSVGNTKPTITETTIGQASSASGQVKEWEPGKVYSYWITLNGAANECRMSVTIGTWSKQGETVVDVE